MRDVYENRDQAAVGSSSPAPTQTWRNRATALVVTATAAVPAFALEAADVTGAISGASTIVAAGFGAMVVVVGSIWAGRKVLGLLGR